MMRRCGLALAFALCLSVPLSATDYFTMSCTSGNFPLCNYADYSGATSAAYGVYVNRTRVAAGCPDGTDSVLFEFIPTGTNAQFYLGWESGTLAWDPVDGADFFLNYSIKLPATIDWAGNNGPLYMKFVIFGASTEADRLITDLVDNGVTSVDTATIRSMHNIDGGTRRSLTLGAWNHVIEGYELSSTDAAADGALKIWSATSGTFTQGTPNVTDGSQVLPETAGLRGFCIGCYTQTTLATTGSASYELCRVKLTDVFDTNWPTVTGGGGAAAPSRLRLRLAGLPPIGDGVALAALVAGMRLASRRGRR